MSNHYVRHMKLAAEAAFDRLLAEVPSVSYVDFPDHANVGDSAIALGLLEFLQVRGISVESVQTIGTHDSERLKLGEAVLAHGGGNLGGLYPEVTNHRREVFAQTPEEKLLIQAPQTAHFSSRADLDLFLRDVRSRKNYRIGARDRATHQQLEAHGITSVLAPDSVHFLGDIEAPDPIRPFVVLARTDGEVGSDSSPFGVTMDWLTEPRGVDLRRKIRNRARLIPLGNTLLNKSVEGWRRLAKQRVQRGVDLVAIGETIITDRLHAMLLGLQMGRSVVAVDNSYGKVHGYIDSWLAESGAAVTKAESFDEARAMVT